jgi:protein-tyrosine phosphatase
LTYTVAPKLLAGPYPFDVDPLLEAGVTTFVDLTEDGELEPYDIPAGVTHRRFGVLDFGCPTPEQVRAILDVIGGAEGLVYLHCRGGCGRTGTILGCYLVEQGLTGEQALERVRELTGGRCPEMGEQEALVLAWNRQNGDP